MLQSTLLFFPTCSYSSPPLIPLCSPNLTPSNQHQYQQLQLNRHKKTRQLFVSLGNASYVVGGGYPDEEFGAEERNERAQQEGSKKLDNSQYDALLKGGEQVISVFQEMITIVGLLPTGFMIVWSLGNGFRNESFDFCVCCFLGLCP